MPENDCQVQAVNQSLTILKGHTDQIRCVRYNKQQSAIASCGDDGIIKLWTSGAST